MHLRFHRDNNFNFLRLLFAYLVILSHSSELLSQDDSSEILYEITHSFTFGGLAVEGFFLISGYLIYQSFENSTSLFSYLIKRILRIYPAFIVCTFLSYFIFLPITGNGHLLNSIGFIEVTKIVFKTFSLSTPYIDGIKLNTDIKIINGSVWTIRYEFICYLLIPLFACIGFSKRNMFGFCLACLFTYFYFIYHDLTIVIRNEAFLDIRELIRLTSTFLVGMFFYKIRDSIIWSKKICYFCLTFLMILVYYFPGYGGLGSITLGAYLLFYFAFNFKNKFTQSIGSQNDISYGVYLYAWPIQIIFIHYNSNINIWLLNLYTVVIATILGRLSWTLIEKPCNELKTKLSALNSKKPVCLKRL